MKTFLINPGFNHRDAVLENFACEAGRHLVLFDGGGDNGENFHVYHPTVQLLEEIAAEYASMCFNDD